MARLVSVQDMRAQAFHMSICCVLCTNHNTGAQTARCSTVTHTCRQPHHPSAESNTSLHPDLTLLIAPQLFITGSAVFTYDDARTLEAGCLAPEPRSALHAALVHPSLWLGKGTEDRCGTLLVYDTVPYPCCLPSFLLSRLHPVHLFAPCVPYSLVACASATTIQAPTSHATVSTTLLFFTPAPQCKRWLNRRGDCIPAAAWPGLSAHHHLV